MDNFLDKYESKAGNNNKYQYIILFISWFTFSTQVLLFSSMPYLQERPEYTIINTLNKKTETYKFNQKSCEKYSNFINNRLNLLNFSEEYNEEKSTNYNFYNNVLNNFQNYIYLIKNNLIYKENKHESHSLNDIKLYIHRKPTSIAAEIGFYCNEMKLAILNLLSFLGAAIGYLIAPLINTLIGRKLTIVVLLAVTLLDSFVIAFAPSYELIVASFFIYMVCSSSATISIFLYLVDITSTKRRSLFTYINNLGFSCSIIFNVSLLIIFNNYQVLLYVNSVCAFLIIIAIITLGFESPKYHLENNNYKGYVKTWKKIATFNKRLSKYSSILEEENVKNRINSVKNNLPNSDLNNKKNLSELQVETNIKINSNSNSCLKNNEKFSNNNENKESLIESEDAYIIDTIKDYNEINNLESRDRSDSESSIITKKKQNVKRSMFDLCRYKSQRITFIIINFTFFVSIGSYFANTVNIKNLPVGDIYFMGYIDGILQFVILIILPFIIEIKFLGRKGLMIGSFFLLSISSFMLTFINLPDNFTIFFFFFSKGLLTIITNSIYIIVVEVYPTSVRKYGTSIGFMVGKLGAVLLSFISELVSPFVINLIFFIGAIIVLLSYFKIEETQGKPLKNEIPELCKDYYLLIEDE